MADERFFDRAGPFTVSRLAEIGRAEIGGAPHGGRMFVDVAPLSAAGPSHVSFLDNRKYVGQFRVAAAGACVARPAVADQAPPGMILLLSDEPYHSYARIAQAFYPAAPPAGRTHPCAVVHPSAVLAQGVRIDAGAVIGPNVEIGAGSWICANATIDRGVVVGARCVIGANASVSHAIMGAKVVVYPGARIGQDGFGFAMGPQGHLKVPQLGRVLIGDDVEIGANATIDRGAGTDTRIGSGARIDNLVQIGHNVEIGDGSVIVAQAGVSGSTKFGRGVIAGGQSGFAGHLSVGDGARFGAQSGVIRDVPGGMTMMGSPARPSRRYWREVAATAKLARPDGSSGR